MTKRLDFEGRVFRLAIAAGLPGSLVALVLLWTGEFTAKFQWTFTLIILLCWLGFVVALRHRIVFQLQVLSNIVGALREGDYSMRARGQREGRRAHRSCEGAQRPDRYAPATAAGRAGSHGTSAQSHERD